MPMLITERIEFCKEIRPVKLVPSSYSPHLARVIPRPTCMQFALETTSGKLLEAEGCPVLVACNYESWQRQVFITGTYKRFNTLRIGVELTTPTVDPFDMIRPGWFGYNLHIPSNLPLQPFRMYENFKIHQSNFE